MPSKYFIKFLLIVLVLMFSSSLCHADSNEEAYRYYEEGNKFNKEGQFDKAIESFQKAIITKPDFATAFHALGSIYLIQHNLTEAITPLKEFLRLAPDNYLAYFKLGLAYSGLKDYVTAKKFYLEALKIKPDYAEAYQMLGSDYLDLKQYEEAIKTFKKTIQIQPGFLDAYLSLGNAYFQLNQYENSIEAYKQAIVLKPDFAHTYYFLGNAYYSLNQYENSIESYKQAIKLNPDFADAYYFLGLAYFGLGQNERAIECFNNSLRIKQDNPETHFFLGLAFNSLKQGIKAVEHFEKALQLGASSESLRLATGETYSSLGENAKALQQFEEAIKLNPSNPNLYVAKGNSLNAISRFEEAEECYKKALTLDPSLSDAHYMLGHTYAWLHQFEKSYKAFNEALRLKPDFAEAHFHLGHIYLVNSKYDAAEVHLVAARELFARDKEKKGLADALMDLGKVRMHQGTDAAGFNLFEQALQIYRDLGLRSEEAQALFEISGIYVFWGNFVTAIKYKQETLKIYDEIKEYDQVIFTLGSMALSEFQIGFRSTNNYDKSLKYAEEAIKVAQVHELEGHKDLSLAYEAKGRVYWFTGKQDEAIAIGRRLLDQFNGLSEYRKGFGCALLGYAYDRTGDLQTAEEFYRKAGEVSLKLDDGFLKWMSNWGLARVNEKRGNIAEATGHYKSAIETLELMRKNTQTLSAKIFFATDANEVYNDFVLFLIKIGDVKEAFNYSERVRSRAFLDLVGTRFGVQSALKSDMEVFEQSRALELRIYYLAERLDELNRKSENDSNMLQRNVLSSELKDATGAYTMLIQKIKSEHPEMAQLLTVQSLTLNEVQDALDSETTLLEYFITPDKTLLWVVDKEHLNVISMDIKATELASKVEAYRKKITTLQPEYKKDAEELYNLLIKPAKSYIKTKRIGIVPHSVLHYLPFQALIGEKGKFLIEEYDLFYTPSASVLKFVYEKRKEIKGKVLAFGNPDIGDEKLNLPYAEDEVTKIKAAYPEATLYLKEKATEDKAKKLSVAFSKYNIIHFASHGELNSEAPMSSNIRLAKDKDEDGKLDVNEIFNLDLKNTSLVTLSACETGLGKLTSGDELIGLTRGFIYAGTPSIVASLWKVYDQSTSEFMSIFYENLKKHPKSESLRMAQLEMIKGKTGKGIVRGVGGITGSKEPKAKPQGQKEMTVNGSHPYFWAPFILVGDWK